ncbi:MAG TPA: hypothetical protein VFJ43_16770, partial [Bacteroidia bacterium]|nr:hypothetical protein [Bacteroidia bacterium]
MKTTILFALSFFCLISFTTVKNKTDLQRENLKGKVKTVSEYGYSGNINKTQRYTFTIANYDENGNLTGKLYLTGDSVLMRKSVLVHNAKGQIIEEKVINADGTLEDRYTYKYDINSNRILESAFMDDGGQYGFTSYKYDSKGLLTEEKRGSPNDNENYTTVTYKYDSLGNQIQMNRLT